MAYEKARKINKKYRNLSVVESTTRLYLARNIGLACYNIAFLENDCLKVKISLAARKRKQMPIASRAHISHLARGAHITQPSHIVYLLPTIVAGKETREMSAMFVQPQLYRNLLCAVIPTQRQRSAEVRTCIIVYMRGDGDAQLLPCR